MTTKCEHPIHILEATSQSEFCFLHIYFFFLASRTKSAKKAYPRFAIFNCGKKLQNIFEIGFKKWEVIEQKLFSEKKWFEINNSQNTFFIFIY